MAKYTVTYRCGHTAEVQLYGTHEERERKIAWYATIDCPVCEAAQCKADAESAGLPELTGTEKQVNWAMKIRRNALEIADKAIAGAPEANRAILNELRGKWIAKEVSASYWIDARYDLDNVRDIMRLIQISTNYTPAK